MAVRSAEAEAHRAADLAACRALLRSGSRSFHLASLLLPRRVSEAATALYAFCRLADDAIDVDGGGGARALRALHEQLDRVYAGHPAAPMERLLAGVVHEYAIPRALLDALLEGFAWDAAGRRYATLAELNGYAARVAGSVGATMTLLMGGRASAVLARACELGVAMQLTNIARDVGQDARAGRLYLPLDWLAEAGIDADAWLARPAYSTALGGVIERLLVAADQLYERSVSGIDELPPDCRPGIHAARLLYAEIGHELRRGGLDSVASRARVARLRQARLVCTALYAATRPAPAAAPAPLEQIRYLVEAVMATPVVHERGQQQERAPEQGRVEWLLELFQRLQERDELALGGEGR
ncbi:MAG TPA: phytoene/squalene synthase family protein [Steroidobacteraceae bacterium]|nr:phytoene/squalene synthase family protein [Steroidobacteraceae bacterium]